MSIVSENASDKPTITSRLIASYRVDDLRQGRVIRAIIDVSAVFVASNVSVFATLILSTVYLSCRTASKAILHGRAPMARSSMLVTQWTALSSLQSPWGNENTSARSQTHGSSTMLTCCRPEITITTEAGACLITLHEDGYGPMCVVHSVVCICLCSYLTIYAACSYKMWGRWFHARLCWEMHTRDM